MMITQFDLDQIQTPAYVLDDRALLQNLSLLNHIQEQTGCALLLALKAFALPEYFQYINQYLSGVSASSLHEVQLANAYNSPSIHVYSPAYKPAEFDAIQTLASHITFNSISQWDYYRTQVRPGVQCGLRLNPNYSEVMQPIYNPCRPHSRFGILYEALRHQNIDGITGFHCHALLDQHVDVLERVWAELARQFGDYFYDAQWLNLGGGHLITDPNYDVLTLINLITAIQEKYQLQVMLEPGASVVNTVGYLVASVVDIIDNNGRIAILDTSATAHMPDVLEMPYTPDVTTQCPQGAYAYQLGGITCLSGDIIGDYRFKEPLSIGDKLVFTNMAQYTMVKNTTFNGIQLPAIYACDLNGDSRLIKSFGYADFATRVGEPSGITNFV